MLTQTAPLGETAPSASDLMLSQYDPQHGLVITLVCARHSQAFQGALLNSLPQQLSFIGLPCTCTLLSYGAVPGYTVESQLKQQTGLGVLLGESTNSAPAEFAPAPAPACAALTTL